MSSPSCSRRITTPNCRSKASLGNKTQHSWLHKVIFVFHIKRKVLKLIPPNKNMYIFPAFCHSFPLFCYFTSSHQMSPDLPLYQSPDSLYPPAPPVPISLISSVHTDQPSVLSQFVPCLSAACCIYYLPVHHSPACKFVYSD